MAKEEAKGQSFNPEDMGEGGNIPWGKNLRVKSAEFCVFNYKTQKTVAWSTKSSKEDPSAFGGILILVDDEGVEYNPQFYSAGDPSKLCPTVDGKEPADVGPLFITNPNFTGDAKINKGTVFATLVTELISAGYPANKVKANIEDTFVDLYAYFDKKTAPKVEGGKDKSMAVPADVLDYPGMPGGSKKTAKGKAPAESDEDAEETQVRVLKKATRLLSATLEEDGVTSVDRAELAQSAITEFSDDDDRDAISSIIYEAAFTRALKKKGFVLNGETITEED